MNFDVEIGSTAVAHPWVPSWDPGRDDSLIASLLTEQGDLSAVERFAQFHEYSDEPLQGRYYSALIPASPPAPASNSPSRWISTAVRAARRASRPATR